MLPPLRGAAPAAPATCVQAAGRAEAFINAPPAPQIMKGGGADPEGTMGFDAIRGVQAKREFYTIMCTFATITKHFEFDRDPRIAPEQRAQRKLRESRVPDIANYILENRDTYVFSSITVSVGGSLRFIPSPGQGSDGRLGKLYIPLDAPILINDGQHRCAAIRAAFEKDPTLEVERVSVVVFEDRGLKRSQQMFADLNKHAVKPTRSLGLLYDHRDTYARFVVTMINDIEAFAGRIEMERTNISHRSKSLFTLNGVADATRYLLRMRAKTKSIAPEKQKLAVEFWNKTAENIPEWSLLVGGRITTAEMRKGYVHAHTNMLNALGIAGHVITRRDDWRDVLKGLQRVDWRKDSPVWRDKIVMDGRMLKNRLGIKRAANALLTELGLDERVEEAV